jgi:hypothetical protein
MPYPGEVRLMRLQRARLDGELEHLGAVKRAATGPGCDLGPTGEAIGHDQGALVRSWFAAVSERRGEDEARAARDLYDWTLARGWSQSYGSGMHDAVWVPSFTASGRDYYVLGLYTPGRIEVFFKMGGGPPFDEEQTRLEPLRQVNEIPGVSFGPEGCVASPRAEGMAIAPKGKSHRQRPHVAHRGGLDLVQKTRISAFLTRVEARFTYDASPVGTIAVFTRRTALTACLWPCWTTAPPCSPPK